MDTMKRPVIQVEGDALGRRHSLDFKQRFFVISRPYGSISIAA
jgi:hypothetical protein